MNISYEITKEKDVCKSYEKLFLKWIILIRRTDSRSIAKNDGPLYIKFNDGDVFR